VGLAKAAWGKWVLKGDRLWIENKDENVNVDASEHDRGVGSSVLTHTHILVPTFLTKLKFSKL